MREPIDSAASLPMLFYSPDESVRLKQLDRSGLVVVQLTMKLLDGFETFDIITGRGYFARWKNESFVKFSGSKYSFEN